MILALYLVAVGLDVATTIVARRAGLREGNPVLRIAGRWWLPVRLAFAAAIAVIAISTGAEWTLVVAAALYIAVAAWNVVMIVRAA